MPRSAGRRVAAGALTALALAGVLLVPAPAPLVAVAAPLVAVAAPLAPAAAQGLDSQPRPPAPVPVAPQPDQSPASEPAPAPAPAQVVAPALAPVVTKDPATPVRVSSSDFALDVAVDPHSQVRLDAEGGVDPLFLDRASWWSGGGDASPAPDNTLYLYGHTFYRPAAFNGLHNAKVGQSVQVTTSGHVNTYRVTRTYTLGKAALSTDARVSAAVPGRLLLLGCWRPRGDERTTTDNVVVEAMLESV